MPSQMNTRLLMLIDECVKTWDYLADPVRAYGACTEYSFRFTCVAAEHNILVAQCEWEHPLVPVTPPPGHGFFTVHVTVLAQGHVIDFTARQFWPDSPFPLVEPLAVYHSRWALSRAENMLGAASALGIN